MLQVNNLTKSYGGQVLLDQVSFVVNPTEKVGLIGRNGHGKSTIFKILTGEEPYDDGNWTTTKNYKIGVLSQYFNFSEKTVLEEACKALPDLGGWKEEYKAELILNGLGFSEADLQRDPMEMSGGFQMRLNLAILLLSESNLLLLDEPTNYLDIVSIRWLEGFLKEWEGEFILITHDRRFMDTVCNHTMGILRRKIKKIKGPTEKWYAQMAEEDEIYEKTRQNEEASRAKTEKFISRFRAQAAKAASVQSRIKMLEKQGVKEKLEEDNDLEFAFRSINFPGKVLQHVSDISFGYTPDKILFDKINLEIKPGDRIGVIGPNGKGKSTFLSILASELQPMEGNTKNHELTRIGYFGQTNVNRMFANNMVYEEIMSVDPELSYGAARSISGLVMFEGDTALKKIKYLSGGEKSRVLLGKILATPVNLLLLDEPTHHLDMQSVESMKEALEEFSGAVVIVSHDELIIDEIANKLLVFDDDKCFVFEGTYSYFLEKIGWSFERNQA
jgi:ATP-binding cassette subfamily F protein 3